MLRPRNAQGLGAPHLERRLSASPFRAGVLCLLASLSACRSPGSPADRARVARKLAAMADADRLVRRAFFSPEVAGYSPEQKRAYMKALDARMVALDRRNTAALKDLLERRNWFTVKEYGAEADRNAWLLVQHADLDVAFQKDVLRRLEPLAAKGQTSPANFAFLFDRVATNEGRLQRYGTQGGCAGPGAWRPNPTEEPSRLDERRGAAGLPPIADYIKESGPGCQ